MWVLDASAVLAFLHGERGADVVSDALADVSVVSAANWAEVLSKFSDEGEDPDPIPEGGGIRRSPVLRIGSASSHRRRR